MRACRGDAAPVLRAAVTALGLAASVSAGASEASLLAELLERANRERAAAGSVALTRSAALGHAAQAKAERLGEEVAFFPSAQPEHIVALADLVDLPEHLEGAGFEARRATAHVVVADRPLTADDLFEREPALQEDLLDPRLREVGLGRTRGGRLEIAVAIVGLSKELDFAIQTRGLEDLERTRDELLLLTNDARKSRRRLPLRRDRCLERVAQRYAERMLGEGFYGHFSPEGYDAGFRVRAAGCRQRHVGENLARGQPSAGEVIAGWLDSPGHRENLLHPEFRRVGFGLALGRKKDDEYWILWVQVLGAD